MAGGYHASARPLEYVYDGSPFDVAVVGEGERPLCRIVESVAGAFVVGVQMSAPFIVFGLVFNLGMGILSRLMPLPDNLAVHSLFPPEFTGMLLGLMCLLQFVASLYIERRYEKKVAKSLFWVIWFPMVYWMIGLLTTLVAFPKVMVKRQRSRARWVSPDRGKGSL